MNDAQIPAPPIHSVISTTVDHNVTIVLAVLAAVTLVFSLYYWWRTGRATFVALFAAGGALMLIEPFVDAVGACWHPSNALRAFMLWERPMPVWLFFAYLVYFGMGGGLTWLAIRSSASPRVVWGLFAAGIVSDFLLEVTLLHWNTYIYYGNQPLVVLKFPLWWAVVNALINVVLAILVVRYEFALRGVRQLLIIPLAMAVSAAVNTIAGLPSWTAINSNLGTAGRQIAGLVTVGVAFLIMWLFVSKAAWKAPTPPTIETEAAQPLIETH